MQNFSFTIAQLHEASNLPVRDSLQKILLAPRSAQKKFPNQILNIEEGSFQA